MVFEDGSDFATASNVSEEKQWGKHGKAMKEVEMEEVKRGEDFVTAGVSECTGNIGRGRGWADVIQEIEIGVEKIAFGQDENRECSRPLWIHLR